MSLITNVWPQASGDGWNGISSYWGIGDVRGFKKKSQLFKDLEGKTFFNRRVFESSKQKSEPGRNLRGG